MEKLLKILKKIKPHIDFTNEKAIIDDGLIDSFDVVVLIGLINDEYKINVPIAKIIPENLNSVEAMLRLIESSR